MSCALVQRDVCWCTGVSERLMPDLCSSANAALHLGKGLIERMVTSRLWVHTRNPCVFVYDKLAGWAMHSGHAVVCATCPSSRDPVGCRDSLVSFSFVCILAALFMRGGFGTTRALPAAMRQASHSNPIAAAVAYFVHARSGSFTRSTVAATGDGCYGNEAQGL